MPKCNVHRTVPVSPICTYGTGGEKNHGRQQRRRTKKKKNIAFIFFTVLGVVSVRRQAKKCAAVKYGRYRVDKGRCYSRYSRHRHGPLLPLQVPPVLGAVMADRELRRPPGRPEGLVLLSGEVREGLRGVLEGGGGGTPGQGGGLPGGGRPVRLRPQGSTSSTVLCTRTTRSRQGYSSKKCLLTSSQMFKGKFA